MKKAVTLTHPDKLLFPKSKMSKKELFNYYKAVSKRMLPLIKDRPISMKRYPQGIEREGFFQKHAPEGHPKWIRTVAASRSKKGAIQMVLCNDLPTLLWIANQNCITLHIWLSRYDKPDLPDRMIFDLDPPAKKGFGAVVQGALALREILEKKLKLKTFLNTTGSKGVHLVVPIKREFDFNTVRKLAHAIALLLVQENPSLYTLESRKAKRRGRLYIDVLRNGYGQTVVAPYSVRALEKGPIATPISWKELVQKSVRSDSFTLRSIKAHLKKNPWSNLEKSCKSIKKAIQIMEKPNAD